MTTPTAAKAKAPVTAEDILVGAATPEEEAILAVADIPEAAATQVAAGIPEVVTVADTQLQDRS